MSIHPFPHIDAFLMHRLEYRAQPISIQGEPETSRQPLLDRRLLSMIGVHSQNLASGVEIKIDVLQVEQEEYRMPPLIYCQIVVLARPATTQT